MFDAISRSEPAPAALLGGASSVRRSGIPMDGALGLSFRHRAGRSVLGTLDQRAPCRAFLPYAEKEEPPLAILVNVAGGLVGGDRIAVDISLDPAAQARITTQAAEKIYRSAGRPVNLSTRLTAAAGSWLEWMPQPTILFDGADVVRTTRLDVAGDARVLAGEILLLGRTAHGERLSYGSLFDAWEVARDGDCVWQERTRVEDWRAVIDAPAAFDGATAAALSVYAGPDAADFVETARAEAPDGVVTGASLVHGLLVVRWLAREAARLAAAYSAFWTRMRAAAGGWPATLPTIWQC